MQIIFYFDPPLLLDRIVGFRHSGGDVDVDVAIVFPARVGDAMELKLGNVIIEERATKA